MSHQQQHSQPHEQNPQEQAQAASLRLDADMQRQVLERAARMQQHHENTLSAEELEAAAVETGLDAQFVRQAIAQIAAESQQTVMTTGHVRARRTQIRRALLSPHGEQVMAASGLLLAVLCAIGRLSGPIFFAYGGFVIALCFGILLARPTKAFALGALAMLTELAIAKVFGPLLHNIITIAPKEFAAYSAIAGGIAVVGALLSRVAMKTADFPGHLPE